MERNFKVGDKIRIRQWDDMAKEFGIDKNGDIKALSGFIQEMRPLCGKKAKIGEIYGNCVFLEDFEDCEGLDTDYDYSMDMIEHVEEEKMTSNAVTNALMKVLGVEVGEEFNVLASVHNPFHFREDGHLVDKEGLIRADTFGELAMCIRDIQKISAKEMTLEEIEKELGYKIKIVAGKEEKE